MSATPLSYRYALAWKQEKQVGIHARLARAGLGL